MLRTDGYYWARQHRAQQMMIVLFQRGAFTFEGEEWSDDEAELIDISGPITPPSKEDAVSWRDDYKRELACRLLLDDADEVVGGWDYLFGYYWVKTTSQSSPELFWYMEGWGPVVGDDGSIDYDKVNFDILSGPLTPPDVVYTSEDLV